METLARNEIRKKPSFQFHLISVVSTVLISYNFLMREILNRKPRRILKVKIKLVRKWMKAGYRAVKKIFPLHLCHIQICLKHICHVQIYLKTFMSYLNLTKNIYACWNLPKNIKNKDFHLHSKKKKQKRYGCLPFDFAMFLFEMSRHLLLNLGYQYSFLFPFYFLKI